MVLKSLFADKVIVRILSRVRLVAVVLINVLSILSIYRYTDINIAGSDKTCDPNCKGATPFA